MKKILKSRMLAFVLGAIIFSGITVVASELFASSIKYEPNWKKSNGDDITNVAEAIDELYYKANSSSESATIINFAYGTPSLSSTRDYKDLNKNVFAGLIGGQKLVCITYNNKLECFTNNNKQNESVHLHNVFGNSCSESSNYACNNDDFLCIAYSSGDFICIDNINKKRCDLLSSGNLYCYDA